MADTVTTNYHWVKPEPHFSPLDWGIKWNADLDLIDAQVFQTASAVGALNGTSGKPTTLVLDKATVAAGAPIIGQLNGVNRWAIQVGGQEAEGTGTAGSNFTVSRYDNSGTYIDQPLSIARANGQATFAQPLNATGLISANGGVTAKTTMSTVAVGAGHSYVGFFDATPARQGYVGWLNGSTAIALVKDGGANIQVGASIALNGNVSGNGIGQFATSTITGNATIGGTLAVTGGVTFANTITAPSATLTQGSLSIKRGSNTRALILLNDNAADRGLLQYDSTTATVQMASLLGASSLALDSGGSFTFNGSGTALKAGGGSWTALSDARLKDVVNAYDAGLNEVLRLRPVIYRYKGADKVHVGLVAQQAELVMPELVTMGPGEIDGQKVDDLRSLDPSAVIWALVNACKDLKREVDELRAKLP